MPGLLTQVEPRDVRAAEDRLVNELVGRAQDQIGGIGSANDVHVRDLLPDEDLDQDDANNDNGWNGSNREWLQSGLSADQQNQVYEIDPNNNAENKVYGIFAVSNLVAQPSTTEITFEDGTGSEFERLMMQEAQTFDEYSLALLRNPIIVDEGKEVLIHQWVKDAGDERVVYHGAVAEKAGTTIGERRADARAGAQATHRRRRA